MAHCMAIPTLPLFVETCPTAATIEKRQQRMRCLQARSVVFARQDAGSEPMRWQYRHRVGRLAVQGQCEARALGELDVR